MLKVFKDFFACKIVFDANHHHPENIQRLFHLQNCLRRKSPSSWNYSKIFSPAILSYPQIIIILKVFKDFFACKIVLDANHHYPENIQRLFHLQNCLRRKSSLSWKYSKNFSPAKLSSTQIIIILKIFKDFFACKIVLRKSSLCWKYFFTCKIVLDANHHLSWKHSKNFSACKIVFDANHLYPENIQKFFRLQYCLIRKSSLCWKYSKTFSPAKMSSTQITIILKIFKDFFTCNIVLDANHHYPESIQRIFPLQNCLRRKSSLSWKYAKFFSPAKLS